MLFVGSFIRTFNCLYVCTCVCVHTFVGMQCGRLSSCMENRRYYSSQLRYTQWLFFSISILQLVCVRFYILEFPEHSRTIIPVLIHSHTVQFVTLKVVIPSSPLVSTNHVTPLWYVDWCTDFQEMLTVRREYGDF